jgi:hypothetical protein
MRKRFMSPWSAFEGFSFNGLRFPCVHICQFGLAKPYMEQNNINNQMLLIIASSALRQVRSTLQRRHEATDGFNRIRKRRTYDPGGSSPWVSSTAASGGTEAKVDDQVPLKCPWLSPKVVEQLGYVMGIVRERA